jgi:hypothetical protein
MNLENELNFDIANEDTSIPGDKNSMDIGLSILFLWPGILVNWLIHSEYYLNSWYSFR